METKLSVINYALAVLSLQEVESSYDTSFSRVACEELPLVLRDVANESDWSDITKDTFLSDFDKTVQFNVCGGAVQHIIPGDAVRVDSVWDIQKNYKLLYINTDSFQTLVEAPYVYATTDIDWLTVDNDFTYFYEVEQSGCYFTYFNNSIFIFPNVSYSNNYKLTYVTKPSVPPDDTTPFDFTDELASLVKRKLVAKMAMYFRPELYVPLETSYMETIKTTRVRNNYHPNRQRRSVI